MGLRRCGLAAALAIVVIGSIFLEGCSQSNVNKVQPRVETGTQDALQSGQPIRMNLDYITDLPPVTTDGSRSLVGEYERVGFQVRLVDRIIEGDPDDCWRESELNGLMTTDEPPPAGTWSLHGVVVTCCEDTSFNEYLCSGHDGTLWLPWRSPRGGTREHFAIYSKGLTSPGRRLKVALHESGHVFNLHHSEYEKPGDLDKTGTFGDASRRHFQESERNHVKPGIEGDGWCELTDIHRPWHTGYECADSMPRTDSVGIASLAVVMEKSRYFPGEPVTVNVILSADHSQTQGIPFRTAESLSPPLGYLRFWVGTSEGGPFEPLANLAAADASLKIEPLEPAGPVTANGLRLWTGPGDDRLDKTFWLMATYTGFEDPNLVAVTGEAVRVEIVDTSQQPPGLFDREALDAFDDEESQLFMLLFGGDHLEDGMARLRDVARDHETTIYAPYANLALGVNLAEPFHKVENRVVVERPADLEAAREHLEAAKIRAPDLPRSHVILLDLTLGRVYHRLAEAAADPNTRDDLYVKSCHELVALASRMEPVTHVAPAPGPVSLKEQQAMELARTEIQLIEAERGEPCRP